MPTPKEIFKNGILKYDFKTVVDTIGLQKAVYWGEFTENWSEHQSGGNTYPLSGFPFQVSYQ